MNEDEYNPSNGTYMYRMTYLTFISAVVTMIFFTLSLVEVSCATNSYLSCGDVVLWFRLLNFLTIVAMCATMYAHATETPDTETNKLLKKYILPKIDPGFEMIPIESDDDRITKDVIEASV